MNDPFALFGVPRQLWLEEEALKSRFHALSAEHHPDVAPGSGGEAFAALNTAYRTLREPRTRLRAWLELEGAPRQAAAPAEVMALFPQMGAHAQALDAFLKRREAASSALAKALLLEEQYTLSETLETWLATLEEVKAHTLATLPALDAAWPTERELVLREVEAAAQTLGYVEKWLTQTREGVFKLQFG